MAEKKAQPEADSEFQKARKKVDIANKWRLFFLVIALLVLLFIFWGDKFWGGAAWYAAAKEKAYLIALVDLLGMLIATFTKLIFAVQYNKKIKKL